MESASLLGVLRLLHNPPVLRDFLEKEIAALDRLVERAMKKKPKSVRAEKMEKVLAASV